MSYELARTDAAQTPPQVVTFGLTEEQRALRRGRVVASSAAALLGQHPYRSQGDAVAEALGVKPLEEDDPTGPARVGQVLEQTIATWLYAVPRGLTLVRGTSFIDPDRPWLLATPDAGVLHLDGINALAPLPNEAMMHPINDVVLWRSHVFRNVEIKVVGQWVAKDWGSPDDGADGLPTYVRIQAEVQMAVAGVPATDVVALVGGTDLRVYQIESYPRLQRAILQGLEHVHQTYIQQGRLPPPDGSRIYDKLVAQAWPQHSMVRVAAPPEIDALGAELINVNAALRELKTRKALLEQSIKIAMADAEAIDGSGWSATWRTSKGGRTSWKKYAISLGGSPQGAKKFQSGGGRKFALKAFAEDGQQIDDAADDETQDE